MRAQILAGPLAGKEVEIRASLQDSGKYIVLAQDGIEQPFLINKEHICLMSAPNPKTMVESKASLRVGVRMIANGYMKSSKDEE